MIHPEFSPQDLTDEQLVGQRLVVGFEGKTADHALEEMIRELRVGGLVLFKRNVGEPAQLAALCGSAQSFAARQGLPPLLICIDQEGGPVARLGPPFTVFPGARHIGERRSTDAAQAFGRTTADELRSVGINVNFAPVLDVVPEGLDRPVMAERVFGSSADLVADLGTTVIRSLQENGVAATAKHFPGIGRTVVDSHLERPVLDTPGRVLAATDLVPFRAAVDAGVEAVMFSHVVYEDLDPHWPASLSSVVSQELLRKTLGFQGVTFTDDLDMGAIEKHYDVPAVARRIVEAPIDIALVCRNQKKAAAIHEALLKTVRTSQAAREQCVNSVTRILRLKQGLVRS